MYLSEITSTCLGEMIAGTYPTSSSTQLSVGVTFNFCTFVFLQPIVIYTNLSQSVFVTRHFLTRTMVYPQVPCRALIGMGKLHFCSRDL